MSSEENSTVIKGIVQHSIVICVEKKERGLQMQALLTKRGFKVAVAITIYDVINLISQEMPHLVITDSLVSDGSAGTLFDRIAQHAMLKATPILVLIPKKTAEHLAPLKGRQFAGFLLGELDAKLLLAKVGEILDGYLNVSPYFVQIEKLLAEPEFTLSISAMVIGISGEQAVCRSQIEVDATAMLVCLPQDERYSPLMVSGGANIIQGEQMLNLFPMAKIRGKGRKWLATLPKIETLGESPNVGTKEHQVLFFEPNEARFTQFATVLKGYQIDLIHAATIQTAQSQMEANFKDLACVFLHEMTPGASTIAFKEAHAKLPASHRPPVIVGTGSLNTKNTADYRYIKKPFGLGSLVETMQSCFTKSEDLKAAVDGGGELGNISVYYQSLANLIGLDECGGILQIQFPVVRGSRLVLNHPILAELWDGNVEVLVTEVMADPKRADSWQARFVPRVADGSKTKYWGKVAKRIQDIIVKQTAAKAS